MRESSGTRLIKGFYHRDRSTKTGKVMKRVKLKRTSKPGRGKAKGGAFERKVCKALSLWVSGGDREDLFWRSAMSGGRATQKLKKGKKLLSQTGDISAIDPMGDHLVKAYYLECKNYKDLNLAGFLFQRGVLLQKFWDETIEYAFQYEKLPMLIAKQNQYPTLVLLPEGSIDDLCIEDDVPDFLMYVRYDEPSHPTEIFLFDEIMQCTIRGEWRGE